MNNNLTQCMEACRQQCLELYPKTELHRVLELGLVLLIFLLVVLGLIIGWRKINEAEKKEKK